MQQKEANQRAAEKEVHAEQWGAPKLAEEIAKLVGKVADSEETTKELKARLTFLQKVLRQKPGFGGPEQPQQQQQQRHASKQKQAVKLVKSSMAKAPWHEDRFKGKRQR